MKKEPQGGTSDENGDEAIPEWLRRKPGSPTVAKAAGLYGPLREVFRIAAGERSVPTDHEVN